MEIVIKLSDALATRAQALAEKQGRTLASIMVEGLELIVLRQPENQSERVSIPVLEGGGGVLTGVDINNSAALEQLMDDDEATGR